MSLIYRNEDVAYRIIGEEAVLLNPEDNQIHVFNEVATFVWEQLSEPCSMIQAVHAICREFDVQEEVAERDISELLDDLKAKGLVRETVRKQSD